MTARKRTAEVPVGEDLVRRIAEIVDDKQGDDIVALDMRKLVGYTDYLLICTARNERLSHAIADEVHHQLKSEGMLPARTEGDRDAEWVLVDYLDCILHIFTPDARDRYRLDRLWGEAGRVELGLGEVA